MPLVERAAKRVYVEGIAYDVSGATFARGGPGVPLKGRRMTLGTASPGISDQNFVVIEFNGENPIVFAGPSHLSAARTRSASDRLLAIRDRDVAAQFAVEALKLFSFYAQRSAPGSKRDSDAWLQAYARPINRLAQQVLTGVDADATPSGPPAARASPSGRRSPSPQRSRPPVRKRTTRRQ